MEVDTLHHSLEGDILAVAGIHPPLEVDTCSVDTRQAAAGSHTDILDLVMP